MQTVLYKSAHKLAKITIILLTVGIVFDILDIVSRATEIIFFPDIWMKEELSDSETVFSLMAVGAGLLYFLNFAATIILFLMWLFQSYKNLYAFGINGLRSSPAWAVGCWFIPFLNLIVPLKTVNEVYHASDPDNLNKQFYQSENSTTFIHGLWWAVWLIGSFLGNAVIRGSIQAETESHIKMVNKVGIISSFMFIIAAFLLMKIIKKIDLRQTQIGGKFQNSMLPPEPEFYKTEEN